MSQRRLSSKIVNERIEKAKVFARKGQYQKARYMLQDVQSEPAAQKLLKQMDGRKDQTGFSLTQFFSGTILVIIGLSALVIFVFYNSISEFRGTIDNRNAVVAEFDNRGLDGNRALFVDLVYYCYEVLESTPDSCVDWAESVFIEYQQPVRFCVLVDADDGMQFRGMSYEELEMCFNESGIPAPQ